jgi:dTDP-glucose pyrophosphorylase
MIEQVCILLAGRGSRMGTLSDGLHKSLLPLGGRAILSRILTAFPSETRFVLAVHHLEDQIRDFLRLAHPDLHVSFVHVTTIDGPTSGPGRSLLECAPLLQDPFLVVCGDSLFEGVPKAATATTSWMGIPSTPIEPGPRWCNIHCGPGNFVDQIIDKKKVSGSSWRPFNGVARVGRPGQFFKGLQKSAECNLSGEVQLSAGFQELIADGITAEEMNWTDVGTHENYHIAQNKFAPSFEKFGEATYFEEDRVIKFFKDSTIVDSRCERAHILQGLTPAKIFRQGNFFLYQFVPGKTLSTFSDPATWEACLRTFNAKLWTANSAATSDLNRLCRQFYVEKTIDRMQNLRLLLSDHAAPEAHQPDWLSTAELESVYALTVRNQRATRVHGDFQCDNIIVQPDGDFKLIDWRQDFAGCREFGDMTWDLAKFNLYLRFNLSDKSRLGKFATREPHFFFEKFRAFANALGVEPVGLDALSALALIQMSGLHAGTVGLELYSLGERWLREVLKAKDRAA